MVAVVSRSERVYVVDDDEGVRLGLGRILQSSGLEVMTYASPREFLAELGPADRGCLVLDIRFPDMNGLDFQSELAASAITMPVIIMTGHADVPSSIRGLKSGAVDFLLKPFDDVQFLDAVAVALEKDRVTWTARTDSADASTRYAQLTIREKEVLVGVTAGLMNKQIAADLGISVITVKIHRGTMMRKMGVRTLVDLVKRAVTLHLDANDRSSD